MDTRLRGGVQPGQASAYKVQKVPQSLLHLQNYCTESDWVRLSQSGSVGVHALAQTLRKLGVQSLKDTKKHATCVLASWRVANGSAAPTQSELLELAQSLTGAFQADRTQPAPGVAALRLYPSDPVHLSAEMHNALFAGEPAVAKDLPFLQQAVSLCRVRKDKTARAPVATPVRSAVDPQAHVQFMHALQLRRLHDGAGGAQRADLAERCTSCSTRRSSAAAGFALFK